MSEPADIQALTVIPVYNQPARLVEVVRGALKRSAALLIVDDGSDEPVATLDGLAELDGVTIVRHQRNLGKGRAIRTAADWAAARGYSHIITLDADGQHDPDQAPRFVEAAAAEPDAIVIGVRDFESSDAPGSSRFGRRFGNFWVRLQTGTHAEDIQSGYRAYPVEVVRRIKTFTGRYGLEVELVVRALWAGAGLVHVPIDVYYPPPEKRVSHFNKLRDNAVLALLNTYLTIRAIIPWPHRKRFGRDRETAPAMSILHPLAVVRLLMRQDVSAQTMANSAALGILLGAPPLIGLHTVSILVAATWLKLNRVMAIVASQLCMPPLVPAICIEVGYFLTHGSWLTFENADVISRATMTQLAAMAADRFMDWLLGSLIVAPVMAAALWLIVYVPVRLCERARHD